MNIPQKLRETRLSRGLTLNQLGSMVGRSKQYMHELETGDIRLSYELAVKIAQALCTTPDEIFLHNDNCDKLLARIAREIT